MVESYQDTRLSSPYSSILERDQYLGSDFARMMERGGHIATIEPTDSVSARTSDVFFSVETTLKQCISMSKHSLVR